MPFCPKCGNTMGETDVFCRRCGTNVTDSDVIPPVTQIQPVTEIRPATESAAVPYSPIALQQKTRTETLEEMDRMIRHFRKAMPLYEKYDQCLQDIAYLSKPGASVRYTGGRKTAVYFIMSPVMMVVGLFAAGIAWAINETVSSAICAALVCWVIAIILSGVGTMFKRNNRQLMEEQRVFLLNEAQDRFRKTIDALSLHYQKYGYCAVGESYTNPKILGMIQNIIQLGRADTMKEAINVMIQDTHNSEMELQAKMTARSAASAARGAKAAAFFTAADFFLK